MNKKGNCEPHLSLSLHPQRVEGSINIYYTTNAPFCGCSRINFGFHKSDQVRPCATRRRRNLNSSLVGRVTPSDACNLGTSYPTWGPRLTVTPICRLSHFVVSLHFCSLFFSLFSTLTPSDSADSSQARVPSLVCTSQKHGRTLLHPPFGATSTSTPTLNLPTSRQTPSASTIIGSDPPRMSVPSLKYPLSPAQISTS
jgi:hypothetical protein